MENQSLKRCREIKIRLTEEEHDRLQSIKTQPQLAVWIRELALNPTADMFTPKAGRKKAVPIKLDNAVERGLAIANNNLNQVAKSLNSLVILGSVQPLDVVFVNAEIEAMKESINAIFREVSKINDR